MGALASILVLVAIALAGCTPSANGSAGSTAIEGGAGLLGPGDGGTPRLQVSIEPAAPTVCPGGCVSLSAQAAGATPPFAIAWGGVQGDGSTVQVCPAATTTRGHDDAGAAGAANPCRRKPGLGERDRDRDALVRGERRHDGRRRRSRRLGSRARDL